MSTNLTDNSKKYQAISANTERYSKLILSYFQNLDECKKALEKLKNGEFSYPYQVAKIKLYQLMAGRYEISSENMTKIIEEIELYIKEIEPILKQIDEGAILKWQEITQICNSLCNAREKIDPMALNTGFYQESLVETIFINILSNMPVYYYNSKEATEKRIIEECDKGETTKINRENNFDIG